MITSAEMESLERVRCGRARTGDRLTVVSLVDRLLEVLRAAERDAMVLPARAGTTLEKQAKTDVGNTRAPVVPEGEPSPREWLLARAVHRELADTGLTDEQRHIVRAVILTEMMKARADRLYACRAEEGTR